MSIQEKLIGWQKKTLLRKPATASLTILGISLPPSVQVGNALRLPHGAVGLVVHEDTVIGDNVTLYQNVTLGRSDVHLDKSELDPGGRIIIEEDVMVGAGAAILFRSGMTLTIGKGAVIGANAVVLSDVPGREIWAGNPAKRCGVRRGVGSLANGRALPMTSRGGYA